MAPGTGTGLGVAGSGAGGGDGGGELAGEVGEVGPFPIGDEVFPDQGGADAKGGGPGGEPVGDGVEVDATCRSKLEVGHGGEDIFEVAWAEVVGGEDFDQVGTGFGGGEDFRGRQSAGHDGLVELMGGFDDFAFEGGGDDELGTGIDGLSGDVAAEDGADADEHAIAELGRGGAYGVECAGRGHGDFGNGDATVGQCAAGLDEAGGGIEADDGDEAGIGDALGDGGAIGHRDSVSWGDLGVEGDRLTIMDDPFDVLGLARRFDVDESELHRRFIERSAQCHPDRFSDPLEQAEAAERSAAVNEAYRLLRDPASRADVLVVLLGGPAKEEDKSLPPDLLMQMMEVREEMEEAVESGDQETLERLRDWAAAQRQARLAAVAEGCEAAVGTDCNLDELKRVRLELNALRYFERMLEQMPGQD